VVWNIWGGSFTAFESASCWWWALIEDILLMVFVVTVLAVVVFASMVTTAGVNDMGVAWKVDSSRVVGVCMVSMGMAGVAMLTSFA